MKNLIDPFELVATALKTPKETLGIDSKMHEHPNWDSIENIEIIVALETNYGIIIEDGDVMNYTSMQAIVGLYKKLQDQYSPRLL